MRNAGVQDITVDMHPAEMEHYAACVMKSLLRRFTPVKAALQWRGNSRDIRGKDAGNLLLLVRQYRGRRAWQMVDFL
ncbi:uncharacterized protein PITG_17762 [Phytophthora infestans T30-4]|uniref:Uncharacterized protein n=2 Tax=Phytophthora infestans TaxID=4787 RepID=D0NW79_PHYIT|nr:uncharacterized protein PITG_17762 [Phytophthora infestans T30-4]EEY66896.1 hypothetical protein PITG_17762 [Phytophthora infestans T30-4]KAF4046299.1 hypothetical protein GN244_ATG01317 [Phytophthora infestans]|eukprot:XP_002896614.1 hypothetical protein PITG_17762 [Phytophthora infestans T30-4]